MMDEKVYEVYNLATGEQAAFFAKSEEEAVACAYVDATKKSRVIDLQKEVEAAKSRIIEGERSLAIGDWCVLKC